LVGTGSVFSNRLSKVDSTQRTGEKVRTIFLIVGVSLFLAACGAKSQPTESQSTIAIRYDGKEIPFVEKSAWQTVQKALFGSSPNVANNSHALRWISIRNYDSDGSKSNPNHEQLTAPEQVKIFLSLHDDAGTDVNTPLKIATYKGDSSAPMTFELINVFVFKDGKEQRLYVYPSSESDPTSSQVKITAVNGDTISGEINAVGKMDGKELSVKGPFTAKVYKP
jgi:hypothetical protein